MEGEKRIYMYHEEENMIKYLSLDDKLKWMQS